MNIITKPNRIMKKLYTFFLGIIFSTTAFSQNTAIPDSNFEQALIDLGYDTDGLNNSVVTANINTITNLDLSGKSIQSVVGIEDFTALEILNLSNNNITSNSLPSQPDFQQNTNLRILNISNQTSTVLFILAPKLPTSIEEYNLSNNQSVTTTGLNSLYVNVKNLNINNCPSILGLDIPNAPIEFLNIGECTEMGANLFNFQTSALKSLICNNTKVSSLDLSGSSGLTEIVCYSAQLTSLNIKNGNNLNITNIDTNGNFSLTSICVDDPTYSTNNWSSSVDTWTTFTSSCSLGVEDNELANSINLYPNPSDNFVTINSDKSIQKIEVYNITGKLVKRLTNFENKISINNLSSGIYFLKFSSDNATAVKKIIKQ